MRLAIIGSRAYPALSHVRSYVEQCPKGTVIVTGGWPVRTGAMDGVEPTAGVDRTAFISAEKQGLTTCVVSGSTTINGKLAGIFRNPTIIELAQAVTAFWDGKSTGTLDGLSQALEQYGKQHPVNPTACLYQILVIGPTGQVMDASTWMTAIRVARKALPSWAT